LCCGFAVNLNIASKCGQYDYNCGCDVIVKASQTCMIKIKHEDRHIEPWSKNKEAKKRGECCVLRRNDTIPDPAAR